MSAVQPLDTAWLADHPLPGLESVTDKNSRGRVLAVGGSTLCPGALRLTAEAALRAGAGKVRLGTVTEAALALGIAMPEIAVLALPSREGEIAPGSLQGLARSLKQTDALVIGPGMGDRAAAATLIAELLPARDPDTLAVLDAAAVACAGAHRAILADCGGRLVLTPHAGEMAALTGCDEDEVAADPATAALAAAQTFGAVLVLKGAQTVIATPDGTLLRYAGGGVGLATGGSGDVLAGIIAGLAARGTEPLEAAAWGVWLHGQAGRVLATRVGRIGFLARELLPEIPRLMHGL